MHQRSQRAPHVGHVDFLAFQWQRGKFQHRLYILGGNAAQDTLQLGFIGGGSLVR
ncbi:MAG: hypothetical protein KIT13_11760 [Burkholderiales bacterium]|nr:hypothetical protein [Burkholderiales bacterium]